MFDQVWQESVITPLQNINLDGGYENDLSYLNGWLVHYARDIHQGVDGLKFPVIAAHPDEESIVMQPRGGKYEAKVSENIRTFNIDLALDPLPRETVLSRFESALRDVKKAIGTVNTRNVTLTRVKFVEPEDDNFSFMVISGEIKYNETW